MNPWDELWRRLRFVANMPSADLDAVERWEEVVRRDQSNGVPSQELRGVLDEIDNFYKALQQFGGLQQSAAEQAAEAVGVSGVYDSSLNPNARISWAEAEQAGPGAAWHPLRVDRADDWQPGAGIPLSDADQEPLYWQGYVRAFDSESRDYNSNYDEFFINNEWRTPRTPEEQQAAAERWQRILNNPPRSGGQPPNGGEVDLSLGGYHGDIRALPAPPNTFERADGRRQYRLNGRFGPLVLSPNAQSRLQNDLEKLVRKALTENYDRLRIGADQRYQHTGTLKRSLEESTSEVVMGGDGGFSVKVTPKALLRPRRRNEPDDVPAQWYGQAIFFGRGAVLPRNQRYLRFQVGGQWLTTRNVVPVEGKNVFDLTPEQVQPILAVATAIYTEMLGNIIAAMGSAE